ncbi:MAG: hypothetical protein U0441_12185 [Polyangiaceae bacterium]
MGTSVAAHASADEDAPEAGEDAPATPNAKKHYADGKEALDGGQLPKAIDELTKAYRAQRKAQIAWSLGTAESRMKRYRDAAEHLEKAIRKGQKELEELGELKSVRQMLETAKKNVATLRVKVTPPPGAGPGWDAQMELLVDGKRLGYKGPLPPEVYVEDGTRTVSVRVGNAKDEATGPYEKGTVRELALSPKEPVVVATPTASALVTAPPTAPPPSGNGLRPTILIGGGVLGAGLLGTGAVLLVMMDGKTLDAANQTATLRADHGRAPCKNPPLSMAAQCRTNLATVTARDSFGNTAVLLLSAGGAIALATAIYGLWPTAPKKAEAGTVLVPYATAGEGGAVVRGSF